MRTAAPNLYRRAPRSCPGGVSRNTVLREPHPLYADHGRRLPHHRYRGCRAHRLRQQHGLADPRPRRIPTSSKRSPSSSQRGTAFTMATEVEVLFAEHLCALATRLRALRFVNSGTEAVMGCSRPPAPSPAAPRSPRSRAPTTAATTTPRSARPRSPDLGRPDHRPACRSPTARRTVVLENVIVLPFNTPSARSRILDDHKPTRSPASCSTRCRTASGLVPADREFVQTLRDWTARNGALLVFDEVITFRTEFGGMPRNATTSARPHGARQDDRRRLPRRVPSPARATSWTSEPAGQVRSSRTRAPSRPTRSR
jgi:glutamate-1-semialdehyde 2,1-aminomutase